MLITPSERWTAPDGGINHDFKVSYDPAVAPPEYNHQRLDPSESGEKQGLGVFVRPGTDVLGLRPARPAVSAGRLVLGARSPCGP